ncbi:hypothetical protein GTR02_12765 [Kineococcus sp. R8]|uniref:hypothetical protein n=1 Tax=Kineococcus siccus TaxID=2696567 RepID=UPI00141288FB|nr:hypothetical protein [Kineococcus siccus]NAZ82692.1 hypothetical protein [Kineococcus siccus]
MSTHTTTEPVHAISWTHTHAGSLRAEITCTAPAGAPCRLECVDGCDDGDAHHHVVADAGHCVAAAWIRAAGVEREYAGPAAVPARSGPVELVQDDGWGWRYAEVAAAERAAA